MGPRNPDDTVRFFMPKNFQAIRMLNYDRTVTIFNFSIVPIKTPMKILFLFLLVFPALVNAGICQTTSSPFRVIDAYMRNCPAASERSIADIAAYINRSARTDLEKSRAVYVWMTDNVFYNDAGYNAGMYGDNSAERVLRTRLAVCAGFANLFTEIAIKTGIEAVTITGYAKGIGYNEGDQFDGTNHAWNAVKIDGSWKIYDATWGQGAASVDSRGRIKSVNKFDEQWFNVEPKQSVFTHLSEIPYQNFLTQNISLLEFERLPNYQPKVLQYGFISADELLAQVKTKKAFNLPVAHSIPLSFQIITAPKTRMLKQKERVTFEIKSKEDLHFHLIDEFEDWIPLEKKENTYVLNFIPFNLGEISLVVELPDGNFTVLVYEVR